MATEYLFKTIYFALLSDCQLYADYIKQSDAKNITMIRSGWLNFCSNSIGFVPIHTRQPFTSFLMNQFFFNKIIMQFEVALLLLYLNQFKKCLMKFIVSFGNNLQVIQALSWYENK